MAISHTTDLLHSIQISESGLTLAELLTRHPAIARRTAQRLIAQLIERGQISAQGEGRARRYFGAGSRVVAADSLRVSSEDFPSPDFAQKRAEYA